jgi:type II secretory pathway predicted ATPase ExeA
MYNEFFGLDDAPFTLTPDPRFIVFTPSYNEVLASLYYGLEQAKGLIVLTGEVGTGKTTALRWILRRLDASVLAAYVFNPRLSVEEFYHHVTQMLGIKDWSNKSELLTTMGRVLEERHRRGLRTVIIIDEAHDLSDYVLEEIRLLLNFESDTAKHLQIVLTGQPELRDRLNQPNLRQFKQRVALRCNMHAFPNVEEVDRYISERLLIAGSDNPSVFTPEAVDYIFRCSEGIPRNINNLCDNAMLAAYSAGQQLIGRGIVEEVAEGLDMLPRHELTKIAEAAQDQLGVPGRIMKPESMDDLSTGRERHEAIKPREFAPDPPKNANGNGNGHAKAAVPQVKIQQPAQGNGNGNRNGNGNGNGHHSNNGVKPYRPLEDDEILLEIDGVPTRYKKI